MNDPYEKIKQLVARIVRHQTALRWNDSQFVGRYQRYLGSAKTWRDRLCGGNFQEFGKELPVWERKLENFVAELDGQSPIEMFFPEMPFAKRMTGMFSTVAGQRTDRRCAVALAVTGCGKSAWARWILNQHPREVVYCRANESWRDSRPQIARGIAEAIGLSTKDLVGAAACLSKVIEKLKADPITLIIDEAHEAGVLLLKLAKTIIDESSTRIMLLAYPTLWARMLSATDDARAEAQQLLGRTLKPVFSEYASGVKREDVVFFLKNATALNGEIEEVTSRILPMVRQNGNLRLLADAIESAQIQADVTGQPMDGQLLIDQVKRLCPGRVE